MAKFYTVRIGKKPGIFTSRDECKLSVDGYPGAKYKSFTSLQQAQQALQSSYEDYYEIKQKDQWKTQDLPFEKHSIAVDAACSGNPGALEYQGVDLSSGEKIFHQKFPLGTNNIGEFLAIVHGLSYLTKQGSNKAIYSDSKHAIKWIESKKCKTKLPLNSDSISIFETIKKAEEWLKTHNYTNKILKRHTKDRGEIPADFGRK